MNRIPLIAVVALATFTALPAPSAHADDEVLLPGLRLGLGPQFATDPNDTMLTGQTIVGLDLRFDDKLGVAIELGYSGERRGRLRGRHFVAGGAFRYGGILGLSALFHGIIGRTAGTHTRGVRPGGRFDVYRTVGIDIQYEWRNVPSLDRSESGFRMVFWFDGLMMLKAIGAT